MRIRTTGSMMVENEMDRLRIDDPVSPAGDAARYPNGEILRTALQFLSDKCWQEWEMQEAFIERAESWEKHPRARQKELALAAALLIREIDRLEYLRLVDLIRPAPNTQPTRSN